MGKVLQGQGIKDLAGDSRWTPLSYGNAGLWPLALRLCVQSGAELGHSSAGHCGLRPGREVVAARGEAESRPRAG